MSFVRLTVFLLFVTVVCANSWLETLTKPQVYNLKHERRMNYRSIPDKNKFKGIGLDTTNTSKVYYPQVEMSSTDFKKFVSGTPSKKSNLSKRRRPTIGWYEDPKKDNIDAMESQTMAKYQFNGSVIEKEDRTNFTFDFALENSKSPNTKNKLVTFFTLRHISNGKQKNGNSSTFWLLLPVSEKGKTTNRLINLSKYGEYKKEEATLVYVMSNAANGEYKLIITRNSDDKSDTSIVFSVQSIRKQYVKQNLLLNLSVVF